MSFPDVGTSRQWLNRANPDTSHKMTYCDAESGLSLQRVSPEVALLGSPAMSAFLPLLGEKRTSVGRRFNEYTT